jgi:ureidoglycolate hydrolase
MPIDTGSLTEVAELAKTCEDLAHAALGVAQAQLRAKLITQDEFDQAFQNYGLAMQKARDLYYQASHGLAEQLLHATEVKTLTDQTAALNQTLARLQKAGHVLEISFGALTFIAAVAAAVVAPGPATLLAVGTTGKALTSLITS